MAYTSWNKVGSSYNGIPDYEEPVLLTIMNDQTKDTLVVGGFLKSTDASGHHWIFGIQDVIDPNRYTVIAWGELPDPYKINKE